MAILIPYLENLVVHTLFPTKRYLEKDFARYYLRVIGTVQKIVPFEVFVYTSRTFTHQQLPWCPLEDRKFVEDRHCHPMDTEFKEKMLNINNGGV